MPFSSWVRHDVSPIRMNLSSASRTPIEPGTSPYRTEPFWLTCEKYRVMRLTHRSHVSPAPALPVDRTPCNPTDRTTRRRAGPVARSTLIYPGPGFGMVLEHQAGAILLLNLRNLLLVWLFLVLTCCPREELGPERHPSDTPAASGSSRSPPWWPSASSPRSSGSGGCTSAFVFFCCHFADFGATGERVPRAIA